MGPPRTAVRAGDVVSEANTATVSGHTIAGVPGRFVLDARTNHVITDSRLGPGESIRAGELLLSALVSCAMASIEATATESGYTVSGVRVSATHVRGVADPTRYDHTRVTVWIHGVDRTVAETLVARFTETCPIYNTVRRGSGIELELCTD